MNELTAEALSGAAGVVITLLFSYLPGLSQWFDPLPPARKRLLMLAVLASVAAAAVGLSCVGWFESWVTCDQAGIEAVVRAFVAAAVLNQTAYQLTKRG